MIICVICGEFMSFVKLCETLRYSVVNRTNPPFRLLKQNNSCTFADQSSWPVCRVHVFVQEESPGNTEHPTS